MCYGCKKEGRYCGIAVSKAILYNCRIYNSIAKSVPNRVKMTIPVVDVSDTAGHCGGEVAPDGAEDDGATASHVLTAVVTDTFDDRRRSRVTHAEALRCYTAEECFAWQE